MVPRLYPKALINNALGLCNTLIEKEGWVLNPVLFFILVYMELQQILIIAGFALFFIGVQSVTIFGCYQSFRSLRNKNILKIVLGWVLFLNLAYLFLFFRVPLAPPFKMLLNYLLIYPFFIYMLLCLILFVVFGINSMVIAGKTLWCRVWPVIRLTNGLNTKTIPEQRRTFLKILTSAVLFPVGGCTVYGCYVGRTICSINEQCLAFAQFPEHLNGLRIIQISDIHAGVFMEGWELQPYLNTVNALQPDIIVITGDMITWGSNYTETVVAELSRLQARYGIFVVTGNHDFYGNLDDLCARLEAVNITVLRNRWVQIATGQQSSGIYMIGIDDLWATRYFKKKTIVLEEILSGIPCDGFKILLSHNPTIFEQAITHNVHLTLSGHTHAGQVILPFPQHHGYSFARLIYKKDYGLYRNKDSILYINRGLGVIGPPLRINCPREITHITLQRSCKI